MTKKTIFKVRVALCVWAGAGGKGGHGLPPKHRGRAGARAVGDLNGHITINIIAVALCDRREQSGGDAWSEFGWQNIEEKETRKTRSHCCSVTNIQRARKRHGRHS